MPAPRKTGARSQDPQRKRQGFYWRFRVRTANPARLKPLELVAVAAVDLTSASPPAVVQTVGTLKQLAPLMHANNFEELMELQRVTLETSTDTVAHADALAAAAPLSTYKRRGLQSKDRALRDFKAGKVVSCEQAASAVRRANMRRHTFSICARSLWMLSKRLPVREWARQVRR